MRTHARNRRQRNEPWRYDTCLRHNTSQSCARRYSPHFADPDRILLANTCHGVLGLQRDATRADVKAAYHYLALKLHPDRCKHPLAHEAMTRVNEANETLMSGFDAPEAEDPSSSTHSGLAAASTSADRGPAAGTRARARRTRRSRSSRTRTSTSRASPTPSPSWSASEDDVDDSDDDDADVDSEEDWCPSRSEESDFADSDEEDDVEDSHEEHFNTAGGDLNAAGEGPTAGRRARTQRTRQSHSSRAQTDDSHDEHFNATGGRRAADASPPRGTTTGTSGRSGGSRPRTTRRTSRPSASTAEQASADFEAKMRDRFRTQPDELSTRGLFVTWAGLSDREADRAAALHAVGWYCNNHGFVIGEYIVCRETHKRPADAARAWHIHGVFILSHGKFRSRNRRTFPFFDLLGDGARTLHPEIMSMGRDYQDRLNLIRYVAACESSNGSRRRYCRKEDLFPLVRLTTPVPEWHPTERYGQGESWGFAMDEATDVATGMRVLRRERPDLYYLRGEQIRRNLRVRIGRHQPSPFPLHTFKVAPLSLDLPVVLWGRPGIGKSLYSRAHGAYPLLVRTLDDLKCINEITTHLVFEDMDFAKWEIPAVLSLLSKGETRSIRARYCDVEIPADIGLIFTTNNTPVTLPFDGTAVQHTSIFPITSDSWQMGALRRRYTIAHANPPLY